MRVHRLSGHWLNEEDLEVLLTIWENPGAKISVLLAKLDNPYSRTKLRGILYLLESHTKAVENRNTGRNISLYITDKGFSMLEEYHQMNINRWERFNSFWRKFARIKETAA